MLTMAKSSIEGHMVRNFPRPRTNRMIIHRWCAKLTIFSYSMKWWHEINEWKYEMRWSGELKVENIGGMKMGKQENPEKNSIPTLSTTIVRLETSRLGNGTSKQSYHSHATTTLLLVTLFTLNSRLINNVIFYHSRLLLAAFHLNSFNNFKGLAALSDSIISASGSAGPVFDPRLGSEFLTSGLGEVEMYIF